ncbi:MAG: Uma2 family endonuclease [Defluviitaleaceae bacterium]|nr:Uma2 family endonuclease [Defluviitaleaceae bacterium]
MSAALKLEYKPAKLKKGIEYHNGIPVMMSPGRRKHGEVGRQIFLILSRSRKKGGCQIFKEDTIVKLNEDNKFIPDVAVACDKSKHKDDAYHGAPDLIVEVLSPTTAKNDRTHKKHVYGISGVKEYWIVDVDLHSIEVHLLEDDELKLNELYRVLPKWETQFLIEQQDLIPPTSFTTPVLGGVHIDLYEVFEEILPEGY